MAYMIGLDGFLGTKGVKKELPRLGATGLAVAGTVDRRCIGIDTLLLSGAENLLDLISELWF